MLVQQLAQEMLKTAGDTGNEYASLLPNALADAVEQNGGLGLDLEPRRGGQVTATLVRSPGLGNDVVAHLDAQIASARRLLSAVLRQGQAIRAREVEEVMARLADIQAEMGRRAALEGTRTAILTTAGAALGIPPHTVTIESLADLLAPADGERRARALRRAARPAGRGRARARHQPRPHAPGAGLPRPPHARARRRARHRLRRPRRRRGAHASARGPQASFRTLDLQA